MNARSMLAKAAPGLLLGAMLCFGTACDPTTDPVIAPASQAPDLALASLNSGEVKGLHQILRAIKGYNDDAVAAGTDPWVYKEWNVAQGHLLRIKTRVTDCAQVGDAFADFWSCRAKHYGVFRLKGAWNHSTHVNGGTATTEQDAVGTRLKYYEEITYTWEPSVHTLTVHVDYPQLGGSDAIPGMPGARNFLTEFGTYTMSARTTTKLTTSSSSNGESLGLGLGGGSGFLDLGVSVQKAATKLTSYMDVNVTGNPFWAVQGMTGYKRTQTASGTWTDTQFNFEFDWLTQALAELTTTTALHTQLCSSNTETDFNLSGKVATQAPAGGSKVSANISVKTNNGAKCESSSTAMAAHVKFEAASGLQCAGANCRQVGERLVGYTDVFPLTATTCKRAFRGAFTAAVNWNLHMDAQGTSLDSHNAAGFDIGEMAGGSFLDDTAGTNFVDTFPCS